MSSSLEENVNRSNTATEVVADPSIGNFGNQMGIKPNGVIRYVFGNMGGHPQSPCAGNCEQAQCKDCDFRAYVNQFEIDVAGQAETNVNWNVIRSDHRLATRSQGWFSARRVQVATLSGGSSQRLQFGGTVNWIINDCTAMIWKPLCGEDSLGRWTWTTLRGTEQRFLTLISAYRPIRHSGSSYTGSVFHQQQDYWIQHHRSVDPLEKFDDDLKALVDDLIAQNSSIVLGIDANIKLAQPSRLKAYLSQAGLTEVIQHRHGPTPPTRYDGSSQIDGLFVTHDLLDSACGHVRWFSDHVGLFIDIPEEFILHRAAQRIIPPTARRLTLQNPKIVQKYLSALKESLNKTHLLLELADLFEQALAFHPMFAEGSGTPFPGITEYNRIAAEISNLVLQAEDGCRKFKAGAIPWTPQYCNMIQERNLLHRLKRLRSPNVRTVNSRPVRRLAKRLGKQHYFDYSTDELEAALKFNLREARRIRKTGFEDRAKYRDDVVAKNIAEAQGRPIEKVRKQLEKNETQRINARIIKSVLKPDQSTSVNMVEVPDPDNPDGPWKQVTEKEEIEAAFLESTRTKYRQASNTPLLAGPMAAELGPIGNQETVDAILDGTYECPPGTTPETQAVIRHLKVKNRPENERPFLPSIPEFQHEWCRQRERTSSCPPHHFGHVMACMQDETLTHMMYQLEFIPVLCGFAPDTWQVAVDLALLKRAGLFKVNKLRTVVLFHCLANHAFKWCGKLLIQLGTARQALVAEQGGAQPKFLVPRASLQKRLAYDISRILKQPMIMISNDALGCYDRIVHSGASVAMQRAGLPPSATSCMFSTLQKMRHHARTQYGVSDVSFGTQPIDREFTVPIQGVGQGNGAGPQIWAVVSAPIVDVLRSEELLFTFHRSRDNSKIQFVGVLFVDDTDNGFTHPEVSDAAEVLCKAQQVLSRWSESLDVTGGAIAPEKTFWYFLDYRWLSDGSMKMKAMSELPGELQVRDKDGILGQIERLELSEARRTLGNYLAPNGNDDEQCKVLIEHSRSWAQRMKKSRLPPALVQQAFRMNYFPGIEFALTAANLSEQQCHKIISPAAIVGGQLMHFGRDMPYTIRHGPLKFQGLDFPDPYVSQFILHTATIQDASVDLTEPYAQMIQELFYLTKVEIGCNGKLFSNSYDLWKPVLSPRVWIHRAWEGCRRFGMHLEDDTPDFQLQRVGDQLLMQAFAANHLVRQHLPILNRCRLYLQVLSVADITRHGEYIAEWAWSGNRITPTRRPEIKWWEQHRPSDIHWRTWQQALETTFALTHKTKLPHLLGPGKIVPDALPFVFDPINLSVLQRENGHWTEWHRHESSRRSRGGMKLFRTDHRCQDLPSSVYAAVVKISAGTMRLEDAYPISLSPPLTELDPVMQWLPASCQWIMKNIRFGPDNGATIAKSILDGTCIGVSDGSFNPTSRIGTAAMTLQGPSACNAIFGECQSTGTLEIQDPYRAEAFGLYAMVCAIKVVCIRFSIHHGKVTLACDGLSALRHGPGSYRDRIRCNRKHHDILAGIRHVMRQVTIDWNTKHVYGHQLTRQGGKTYGPLDRLGSLNDDMDMAAKQFRMEIESQDVVGPPEHTCRIYGEMWPLTHDGYAIVVNRKVTLKNIMSGAVIRQHWTDKGSFGQGTADDVDWQAYERAIASLPFTRKFHAAKAASGFLPTRHRQKKRQLADSARCPRCTHPKEDPTHVLRCQAPEMRKRWTNAIEELKVWMENQDTDEYITTAITQHLLHWYDPTTPVNQSPPSEISAAIRQQSLLGWEQLLFGRLGTYWGDSQLRYVQANRPTKIKSIRRWKASLVRKLLEMAWDFWDHRNGELHRVELSILHHDIQVHIRQEFSLGDINNHRLRQLMKPGADAITARPLAQQQDWLRSVRIHRSHHQASSEFRQQQQQQRIMATWLRSGQSDRAT